MLGYEPHEIGAGLNEWKSRVHAQDVDGALKRIEGYLAGRENVFDIKVRMRHKAGHYISILSRGFAVRDAEGKPVRMIGTHVDTTKLDAAEVALRERHEELRAIYGGMADGVLIAARDEPTEFEPCEGAGQWPHSKTREA